MVDLYSLNINNMRIWNHGKMVKEISHQIRETMRKELGELGESIFEKQCLEMGVLPDELDIDDLDEFGDRIYEAVRFFTGMEKAEKVKKGIQKYRLLNVLEEMDEKPSSNVSLIKECRLLQKLGGTSLDLGDMDQGLKYYRKALALSEEIDRKDLQAESHLGLCCVFMERGEFDEAEECLERALKISDDVGYKPGTAESYRRYGELRWRKGEFDGSLETFQKALTLYEDMGDKMGIAVTYKGLGDVYGEMEDYENSLEYYQKSADIYSEEGYYNQMIVISMNIGVIYSLQKDWEKAAEYYRESEQLAEERTYPNLRAWCLFNLGESYIYMKEYEKAEGCLKESMHMLEKQCDPFGEAGVKVKYGQLCLEKEEYERAEKYISQSVEKLKELGVKRYLADALHELGKARKEVGKEALARENMEEAVSIYDSLDLDGRREIVEEDLNDLTKSLK